MKNSKEYCIKKLWDTYELKSDAPFVLDEFGFYCLDKWAKEGHIENGHDVWPIDGYIREKFLLDIDARFTLGGLGDCESEFYPMFEEKVLEDRGEHELVRDKFGREVLYFKNRRTGFMPEYVGHPVIDMKSWVDNCKWRLNPYVTTRYEHFDETMYNAVIAQNEGMMITQKIVGGYMYLRSLFGPLEILYAFYDMPEVVHDCMRTWYELCDHVMSRYQEYISIDEILFAEDISYKQGNLISPNLIKEFLFPYYQQLIENVRKRQKKKSRTLYLHLDTDGNCIDAIRIYKEIGFNVFKPFEVASGCDVVEIGRQFPDIVMSGGIDKRVLAGSKDDLDRYLDNLLGAMRLRGGYIPTCDHGVPEEVPYQNYMLFRKKCLEYA